MQHQNRSGRSEERTQRSRSLVLPRIQVERGILRAQATVPRKTHAERANLPRAIVLACYKFYMLTLNGLVNGAVGVFQEIEYREGNLCYAVRLWIQFDVPHTGCMARVKAKPLA